MKNKFIALASCLCLSVSLSACKTNDTILGGFGAGGAAIGALAGNTIGLGNPGVTLASAAVGGVAGTLLGTQVIKKDGKDVKMCKFRTNKGKIVFRKCS